MYLFTTCFRFEKKNMEKQKCVKDINQNISSNGNNISLSVLGKFLLKSCVLP